MTYTYCGITADIRLWHSVGIRPTLTDRSTPGMENEQGEADGHSSFGDAATGGELIEARATSGATDERALSWLAQERRRQSEDRRRTEAVKIAGDKAVHAARIHRQAALVEARSRGIKVNLSDL